MSHSLLAKFAEKYLSFQVHCRGHCDTEASFRIMPADIDGVVGVYCCAGGYVSRIVHLGLNNGMSRFNSFLSEQLGAGVVDRRDLRVATRYGWELGAEEGSDLAALSQTEKKPVIKEIYWTRYPRTEEDESRGVFLCSEPVRGRGCGRLFVQQIRSKTRLCPRCRL